MRRFCISVVSICCAIVFLSIIYNGDVENYSGICRALCSKNMIVYAISLAIYGLTFLLLNVIDGLISSRVLGVIVNAGDIPGEGCGVICKPTVQFFLTGLISVGGFIMFSQWGLVEQFKEDGVANEDFYNFPTIVYGIIMIIVFCWIYVLMKKNTDVKMDSLHLICALALLYTFLNHYCLNPFVDRYTNDLTYEMINKSSVTETIFNVWDGVPFSYQTTGIYGHYSLFFLPLKLFGKANEYILPIVLAGLACVVQLGANYIICSFSPKKWMAAILVLATGIKFNFTYMAISPIRTIFPMITSVWLVCLFQKSKRLTIGNMLMALVLCTGGILWNLETGVASAFGVIAYAFVELVIFENYRKKQMILFVILLIPVSALLSVLIVNVYNFFCGGVLVFSAFFYPHHSMTGENIMSIINDGIQIGNHMWTWIIVFYLGCVCWAIYDTADNRNENNTKCTAPLVMGISMTGLVSFTYYMHEAHWGNVAIIQQLSGSLSAIIISLLFPVMERKERNASIEKQFYRGMFILIIAIQTVLAIQVINEPCRIEARTEAGVYSLKEIRPEIKEISSRVSQDTYGVGQGISYIYYMLGWSNRAKYHDTSTLESMDPELRDVLKEEILQQDSFLIAEWDYYDSEYLLKEIVKTKQYKKNVVFRVGDYKYGYYTRK